MRSGRAHRNVSEYAAALAVPPERTAPGHCRPCTINSVPVPARSPNATHGCEVLCARAPGEAPLTRAHAGGW
jgi:hypothetical protein